MIKNRLQQKISVYNNRLKTLLKERDSLQKRIDHHRRKMKDWSRTLRRITVREKRLKEANGLVEVYFGIKVKGTGKPYRSDPTALPRKIFYKFCLDHGFGRHAIEVARYAGATTGNAAIRGRRRLMKDKAGMLIYHKFLVYCGYGSTQGK